MGRRCTMAIALRGVIRGADTWVEVAAFGESRQEPLTHWLDLPAGIPSHDTFYANHGAEHAARIRRTRAASTANAT